MRQRLKISLSLLISLLLCGGFAVFSFTRLFNVVETTFFQPQIEKERQAQLEQIAGRVGRYHRDNIEHFQPLVQKDYTWNTFRPSNQLARDDIEDLQIEIGGLLDLYPNIQLIRFLGSDGKSIHFSTLNSDIESQDQQRRKYLDYDRTGESIGSALLLPPGGDSPGVVIDGGDQRFIYSLPVNRSGDFRGVVLFYVSKRDLLEYLLRFPALDVRELSLLGEQGIVFNVSPGKLASIQSELSEIWRENESIDSVYSEPVPFEVKVEPDETIQQEAQVEGRRENYNLLSINTDEFGTLSLLIPYSVFQLQPIMKVVVIAAIFLTVFLILYLVLNLRQDPVLILSQRIKRLQLDILREFIEGKERVDWKQWQKKLQDNRGELKSRIKRGVGRIPSQKGAAIDSMIDRSWDEIISIIETRVGGVQPEAPDIRHIEELLQRALEGAQLTVQAPALQTPKAQPRRAGIVVEEIGVDEVVEPGEVIPSEEAEEIEEAEAVEEAEELGEAEELEEAEAAEEAEELGEAEELEEAGAVEEAEIVEEAGEPLFLEREDQETVEELESVKEIVPLPPLPQEQLEELPTADEVQQAVAAGATQAPKREAAARVTTADRGEVVEELEVAEDETAPIESILNAGDELVMEALPGQEHAKQLSTEEIEKIQLLDEKKQLQELLDAKIIRSYSLETIEAIIMEQRSSVVMEDGVYRIKEEVVSGATAKPQRRGLMALAEASLAEPTKATGLESGIGALLGDESILDLETEIGQIRERSAEIEYTALRKSKNVHFFEDGLDYDEYLKGYRGGKTETDRLRSLVELSGKLKAVNAAVFSKENGKYSLVLKVGLNDPGFEVFFTPEEPLIEMFVKTRQTVFVGENVEKIKGLAKKLHPEDLKYMQAAVLFPAVFRGRESFLFLGLPVRWDLDIEDIITRLDIY